MKRIQSGFARWICFFLAAAMLYMAPGYAAESEPAGQSDDQAVRLLIGLGMLEPGVYQRGGDMSRGVFAACLARCYRLRSTAYQGTMPFLDLSPEHPYYDSVGALYELGAVSGCGDSTFQPDRPILYEEALYALLDLAGSGEYTRAALAEGEPLTRIAAQRGISGGYGGAPETPLTFEQAAQLFYNTLHTDMMELSGLGTTNTYEIRKGESVMEARMKVIPIDGVLSGIGIMNLKDAERELGPDELLIDDVLCVNASGMELSSRFGMAARFYLEDIREERRPVLYADFETRQNRSLTIAARDIADTSLNSITYSGGGGRQMTARIPQDAVILYNGRPLSGVVAEDLHPRYGSVTLIDHDGNGYDAVLIRETETYVIEQFSDLAGQITGKYNEKPLVLGNLDPGHTAFYHYTGKPIGNPLYNCSIGDVLEVMESRDGAYLTIVVSDQSVSGQITAIYEEAVAVDGTAYTLSQSFRDLGVSLELGAAAEFYLNSAGEIAGRGENEPGSEQYGYLVDTAKSGGIDACGLFKIFTRSGELEEMKAADKIKWNAEEQKISGLAAAEALRGKPQLIRYQRGGDGEIISVQTAVDNTNGAERFDKENFSLDFRSEPNSARVYSYTIGANYSLDGESLVFVVPEDVRQEKAFRVGGQTMLSGDVKQITIELYDTDETGAAGVLVRKTASGGGSASQGVFQDDAVIVDDVMQAVIDDEGTVGTMISGYKAGKRVEYVPADDEVANFAETNYWSSKYGKYSGVKFSELQRGDVIGVELDAEGKVSGFLLYLSARDLPDNYAEVMSDGGTPNISNYLAVTSTHFGVVKKCYTKAVLANANGQGLDNKWNRTFSVAGATIYCYDREKDEITLAGIGDIAENDLLFVRAYYRVPKDVVMIK